MSCIKRKKVSFHKRQVLELYDVHMAKKKTNQVELKMKEVFLLKAQE